MIYMFEHDKERYVLRDGDQEPVRCVRSSAQCNLVASLIAQHVPVQLCSACILNNCDTPQEILAGMHAVDPAIPGYAGGWHDAGMSDVAVMELLSKNPREVIEFDFGIRNIMVAHPVIKAGLSFPFNGAITNNLALLIRHIGDICRFVDPEHPTRGSCMRSFYRIVTPRYLKRFVEASKHPGDPIERVFEHGRSTNRASLAFMAWNLNPLMGDSSDVADESHAFLARYMLDYCKKAALTEDIYDAKITAIWKTTIKFMDMVRLLWAEQLGGPPFDPYKFFKRKVDADKFAEYVAR